MKLNYYRCCVDFDDRNVGWLIDVIDRSREITLATFRRHVDPEAFSLLQQNLGYTIARRKTRDLRLCNDRHVRFKRSRDRHGNPVYFMVHSAIEYLFTQGRATC